ncbi:MAG: hypothetical protein ACK5MY_06825 [Jhaorihella sp.]
MARAAEVVVDTLIAGARLCGLAGPRSEGRAGPEDRMRAWPGAEWPAIRDVRVNRVKPALPPEIKAGQVVSTALSGFKAVLNGRASEGVSLPRDYFPR